MTFCGTHLGARDPNSNRKDCIGGTDDFDGIQLGVIQPGIVALRSRILRAQSP